MEIAIELWQKLVVHEVIEYSFDDLMKLLISQGRAVAGGTPAINWANGIVFMFSGFPDTDSVMQEKLHGIIHWSSVMFAKKEEYMPQYRQDANYVNLINASHNQTFIVLAEELRKRSKLAQTQDA